MPARSQRDPLRIVAFDVDGTLLRGLTICQCLAAGLNRADEMEVFESLSSREEISLARQAILDWYLPNTKSDLLRHVRTATLAPGAKEGIDLLRRSGIKVALVSISWQFAVEWLRSELQADYAVGTDWSKDGEISHFWPEDKAAWLSDLLSNLHLGRQHLAAVGDSHGDLHMLRLATRGFFVGEGTIELPENILHRPQANIYDLASELLSAEQPS